MKALMVGLAVAASAALGGCAVYPAPGYAEPAPAYVAPSVVVAPAPYYYGYGYYGGYYRGYGHRHWR